jgi:hypothetical protein
MKGWKNSMLNYLKALFYPSHKTEDKKEEIKEQKNERNKDSYIDLLVSLNQNYQIDISLFIDDNPNNKNITEFEYSVVCADFLNVIFSNEFKPQITDILINQIRNTNNKDFIDKILVLSRIADNYYNDNDDVVIKPSQVFANIKNE